VSETDDRAWMMLNQRGMALPLTLMLVMALMSLTMALLSYGTFEPAISRNLTDNSQARLAAEAGLERALDLLRNTTDWSQLVASATPENRTLAITQLSNVAVAGSGGATFTVTVRNDTLTSDAFITGLTPVDTSVSSDQNGALIVTATGTVSVTQSGTTTVRATKVLEAAVTRPPALPFPAALAFPGNEADVAFTGNTFEVKGGSAGKGFKMNGDADISCAAEYGIAVSTVLPTASPGGNEGTVEAAMDKDQLKRITGKSEPGSSSGVGVDTIQADSRLTPTMVATYINKAKQMADITLKSKQATATTDDGTLTGLKYENIGNTCDSDPNSGNCWGTKDHPKVVWIQGDEDPDSMFAALKITGNSKGYGILIVEDGDLRVNGNFEWYGSIIVTGKWVGVGFDGNPKVYGAVVSNETANDGPSFREGVLQGNAGIYYSCEALDIAGKAPSLTRIVSWKEVAGQ
jgi:Tfp pilus assembly protein PilX